MLTLYNNMFFFSALYPPSSPRMHVLVSKYTLKKNQYINVSKSEILKESIMRPMIFKN